MQMHLHVRWQSILTITLLAIGLVIGMGATVQAQENTENETTETQPSEVPEDGGEAFIPESYRYVVEECNNYTLLVRDSLQLYDAADDDVSLSEEQIIFAETNIVQDLNGPDLIFPGETIEIDADKVAEYAAASQELSQAQRDAWAVYVANARFDLTDIGARNVTVRDGRTVETDDQGNEVQQPDQSDQDEAAADDDSAADDDNNAFWWVVAIGVVGILWYLFWYRDENQA